MKQIRDRYIVCAFILLGALLYLPTVWFGFTLDDPFRIANDTAIRSWSGIYEIFFSPSWPRDLYRPLPRFIHLIEYSASGTEPFLYHLTNIVLYGLVVGAVFLFTSLFVSHFTARLITLLFAVHPIHVEAVANISHRSELMMTLFGLLGSYLVLTRTRFRPGLLLGASMLFLLSLLSKESGASFLLLVPICSILLDHGTQKEKTAHALRRLIPVILGCAAYAALRYAAFGGTLVKQNEIFYVVNPLIDLPTGTRVLNGFVLLGRYASLSLFPWPLGPDYAFAKLYPVVSLTEIGALPYLLLLTTLVVSTFVLRVWHRVWIFVFLLPLLFTSNIIFPIGTIFAERLCFFAVLGICGIAGELIMKIQPATVRNTFIGLLVVFDALLVVVQSTYWQNDFVLHTRGVEVSPTSAKAQQNFAIVKMNEGRFDDAITHLNEALRIYPNYADAAYRIALCYDAKKMRPETILWLNKALEIKPGHKPSEKLLAQLSGMS